jgi:alkylation response protein AidB-like acyl-CoA dehydrogenase
MVIGEVNQGWKIVMGAIDFERAALASHGLVDGQLDRLIAWCAQQHDGAPAKLEDPVARDRLVRLAIDSEATRLMAFWLASLHARGLQPQHETSLAVLVKRETSRLIDFAAMDLLGPFAPVRNGSSWTQMHGEIEEEYRDRMYFQFAAGGFDITRNVVAQRGLGLPR